MFNPKAAAARFAAHLKSNVIAGFDRLQKFSAEKARGVMMASILADRLENRTPGAFGRVVRPHSRPQYRGNKIARMIANTGKVRGF